MQSKSERGLAVNVLPGIIRVWLAKTMLTSLLLALLVTLSGTVATYLYDEDAPIAARIIEDAEDRQKAQEDLQALVVAPLFAQDDAEAAREQWRQFAD